ncbi:hypothetical protein D9M68_705430 [compost metagenome]
MHGGEHTFGQAARGFHGLAVEQAVFHVLQVPGVPGLFEQGFEFRPERLLLSGWVVVEAAAGRAACAVEFLDHALDQQFTRCGGVGLALGGKVGTGLVEHVNRERQCGLVQHGQGPHRHAGLHGSVFNHWRGNAFAQHGSAFHDEGAEGAAGVETARVVHHDGQLAQRLHVVVGARHRLVVRFLAADDLHQPHLVHRAEEMDADELG